MERKRIIIIENTLNKMSTGITPSVSVTLEIMLNNYVFYLYKKNTSLSNERIDILDTWRKKI